MIFPRTYFYLSLCLIMIWFGYGYRIAIAQTETATPHIHNMEELWEWGGRISTMKPVSDTLYVGMGRDLVLFDITDPTAPQERGNLDLDASITDIEIVGTHALLAGGSDGLFIVDISDKSNPALVVERHNPYKVNSIAVAGHYAYVAFEVGGSAPGGIQILDITQPEAPVVVNEQIAGLAFTPNDMQIAQNHLFVAGRFFEPIWLGYSTCGGFQAFDLADPTNPTPLPAYQTEKAPNEDLAFDSMLVDENDAYLLQNDTITRFAINEPARLITTTQLTLEGISTQPPQLVGDRLYVVRPHGFTTGASDNGGVYVLDISLPASILVEKFLPQPVTVIATQGDYTYVGHPDDGLHVLDVSKPLAPVEVGAYKMPALSFADLAVRQQTLYATGGILGTPLLSVIDLHDPTQPTLTTVITGPERYAIYPFVDDERLIMAALTPDSTGYDSYYIFDITNPALPQRLARHATVPFASATYANHQLYTTISNRTPPWAQVSSFDLSDPAHPVANAVIPVVLNSAAFLHSFSVDGEYLYHVGDTEPDAEPYHWTPRLYIYALSTGQAIARLDLPQRIGEIYRHNETLYAVAARQYGACPYTIYMVDIADPSAPYLRQSFCWRSEIDELIFDDHLLYIADRDTTYTRNSQTGLSIVDFTIPHAPRLAGYAYEPTYLAQITTMGDTIYFSGDRLAAYRYTPPQATIQLNHNSGMLDASFDNVTYHFAAEAFTTPVTITHTTRFVDPWLAFPAPWVGVGNGFALQATTTATGDALAPTGAFSMTIRYTKEAVQLVEGTSLALYRWDGGAWVLEPSEVDPATQTVVATPTTTGVWMLRGLARNRLYLPLIHHRQP